MVLLQSQPCQKGFDMQNGNKFWRSCARVSHRPKLNDGLIEVHDKEQMAQLYDKRLRESSGHCERSLYSAKRRLGRQKRNTNRMICKFEKLPTCLRSLTYPKIMHYLRPCAIVSIPF